MQPDTKHASQPSADANAADTERLLAVLRGLATELHGRHALVPTTLHSRLDRDLGLDSVSRIELIERLERTFSVRFGEESVMRADTVADLLAALRTASEGSAVRARIAFDTGPSPSAVEPGIGDDVTTLIEALEWHARTHPDRIHARFVGSGAEDGSLRYGELYDDACRSAAGLVREGIEPGDRVALMLPTGRDYLRSFCAVLLAGAIPVPLYPPSRPSLLEEHLARQQRILENAQAALMITVREGVSLARSMQGAIPSLRVVTTPDDLVSDRAPPRIHRASEDLALLQYTSGSTGDPKGVMLSHRNLLANIRAMGRAVEVTTDDVMVSWLPLYHDMGLIGCWLSPLYFGFPVVLMSPMHFLVAPRHWLWALHDSRGTLSCGPNFAYELCVRRIADEELEGLDLGHWRFALNGSEPVSARTVEAFCDRFARFGFRRGAMLPAYGLAECSVALTFPPLMRGPRVDRVLREPLVARDRAVRAPEDAEDAKVVSLVSCGRPLVGHEVRIVDRGGRECPDREVGDVEFRGPSSTRGYWGRPETTAQLFDGEWLRTGDLGYVADGELHLTGRSKDIIIRAGQHVFPQEIEEVVGDIEGVRRGCVAAFACADRDARTERLVVVAETREQGADARARIVARIYAKTTELLGAPPEEVVLVPPHSVPKTSSGKLRRSACRIAYERGELGESPRSPLLQLARLRARASISTVRRAWISMRGFAFSAYAFLVFSLVACVTWWLVILLPRRSWHLSIVRAATRTLAWMTRTRIATEGIEHLPKGACVLAVNHQSDLDPMVMFAVLPARLSVVTKSELAEHWWSRIPLDRIGVEFVERGVASEGVAAARRIAAHARSGDMLLFFPEGTHSRIPGLLPFRMGAFVTAARASLPIVPIVIEGTRSMLRSDTHLLRRGSIRVRIGEPIVPVGTDFEAAVVLRDAVRRFMIEATREPDLEDRVVPVSPSRASRARDAR